ncbi:hypothetical protein B0T17DRAFT_614728 [Bombardia bombarda]|uniref:Uncharacterized protein n=1 Tax=Bombardia bombarda TaxID=252184 RepID=A0AA39X8V1_9PEZI|nr:hypothetical protein B0T17DRAFT_614728 [Bombardia bombarda]
MASSDSPGTLVFEENQISAAITEDKVLQFFQEHGIFYESDAEIGRLADYGYVVGEDGYYFASTTSEEEAKGRITVFMLRPKTVLEFATESHNVTFQSVPSPYRLRIIPYPQIKGQFIEIQAKFEDGGM